MPAKISKEEFTRRLNEKWPDRFTVDEFTSAYSNLTFHCKKCGKTITMNGRYLLDFGCKCDRNSRGAMKLTPLEYQQKLDKKHDHTIRTLHTSTIVGYTTKVKHKCLICSNIWEDSPHHLVTQDGKCPSKTCKDQRKKKAIDKRTRTQEEIEDLIKSLHGNKIKLIGSYRGANKPHRLKCYVCLNTWKTQLSNVLYRGCGCVYCSQQIQRKNLRKGAKIKHVVIDGSQLRLQGYEPQAVSWILNTARKKSLKLKVQDIEFDSDGTVPVIKYKVGRRQHRYYPDMFIRKQNRIIEVKSVHTLGLTTGKYWKRNQAKAKACMEAGYKINLLVMDSMGRKLPLPKDWYKRSRKSVLVEMAWKSGIHENF